MISTGEYTDLLDLSYYNGSIATLVEDGVLMDITEYVEEYMPDYVALLDEHPPGNPRLPPRTRTEMFTIIIFRCSTTEPEIPGMDLCTAETGW